MIADARDTATITLHSVYHQHHNAVLRSVARIVDHHLAEDIASQTFTIAWRKLAPADVTRTWLLRTAHNLIGDALRKQIRERQLLEHLTSQTRLTYTHEPSEHVSAALEALPPRYRDILRLRYWDDLTPTEIAAAADLTIAATWKRLSRAQEKLRLELTNARAQASDAT